LKMIDDILNDQENSRKKLFDSAAGISKYKLRKREALNKLKSTANDLDRVEDLLHEIESNMKIYESQARKAERYKKTKEKYKQSSLELGQKRLNTINEQFEKLESQKNNQNDGITEVDAAIQKFEAEITQQKKVTLDKEKALAESQKLMNSHMDKLRSKENEKNIINENLKFLRQQIDSFESNKAQSLKNIDSLKDEIKALQKNQDEANHQLSQKEKHLNQQQQQVEELQAKHLVVNEDFTKLKTEQTNYDRQVFDLEKTIAVNQSQKSALELEISEKTEQLSDREKEIIQLKKEYTDSEQQLNKANTELGDLQKREERESKELEDLEGKVEAIQTQLQKDSRQLDKVSNEHNLLKDLIDKLEGFPESIRFLNQNKKWSKSAPLLSDIINCQEDFKIAIENFLEPYLNYYVVNDIEEGIEAISLLSNASKGRANFFILNQIEQPQLETIIPTNGAVMATDIIEYEGRYKNLVAHLLGNVYLIDDKDLDKVKSLSKADNNVYIAKSGKMISTHHTISGGSIGLFEGTKLGRAQKLKKLAKDIKKLEEVCQKLQEKLNDLQTQQTTLKRSDIRHQINLKQKEAGDYNSNLISSKTRFENLERYINENQTKKTDISDRFQFIDTQIVEITTQLTQLNNVGGDLTNKLTKAEEAYEASTQELNLSRSKLNETNIECLQIKNQVESINQQLDFKKQQLDKEQNQQSTASTASVTANTEITQLEQQLNTDDTDLSKLYDDKEALAKNVVAAETTYFDAKQQIDELDKHLRKEQRKKQDQESGLSDVKSQMNDLKLKLISLKDRISIEFNMNVEQIMDESFSSESNLSELEMLVEKLRRKIENYGEVNTLAIEAYNEIRERFDFINNQKADLLEAKESILETIQEIEHTATEKFLTAFEKIRVNFINVFHKLFSEEDNCDLKLIDPDNPMESKIEIVAQPKGKRPLTINQLSGGEKTLTAISLVFALYLLKPAPFCILDEVDAPLDDANISKFNSIIRDFSSESQFILVTHNKTTMATVDIIYGVTMMETGISNVVPVDFRNLN